MTDVLNGLGSVPMLQPFPDWSTNPKYSFLNSLKIIEFEGTPSDFYEISSRTPQIFQAEILLETKAQEFSFMTFWKDRKGSVERFWYPVFPDMFSLKEEILTGSTSIEIDPTLLQFDKERIFINTVEDELWTAKVNSFLTESDKTTLTLPEASGKDISPSDVSSFGLMMLCRFDKNTVQLNHETESVIKVSLDIKEVMEYEEV